MSFTEFLLYQLKPFYSQMKIGFIFINLQKKVIYDVREGSPDRFKFRKQPRRNFRTLKLIIPMINLDVQQGAVGNAAPDEGLAGTSNEQDVYDKDIDYDELLFF